MAHLKAKVSKLIGSLAIYRKIRSPRMVSQEVLKWLIVLILFSVLYNDQLYRSPADHHCCLMTYVEEV
jgi:hypothetical protein